VNVVRIQSMGINESRGEGRKKQCSTKEQKVQDESAQGIETGHRKGIRDVNRSDRINGRAGKQVPKEDADLYEVYWNQKGRKSTCGRFGLKAKGSQLRLRLLFSGTIALVNTELKKQGGRAEKADTETSGKDRGGEGPIPVCENCVSRKKR